ncbi:hypothetical protein P152DRAFT_430174 [Eremomyces bilateralis CBS 781.70]|uniref:FAD-binding FR-type domain-containing protein n=1 Tax=Eremomyces bilateralis CBS 781.70 TaxID=1392243 RepID=A0A6G1GD43_9PEZI|nr:uncharacterized protein P152DRAFT_430174 [Eremomyces bilateralis CBS 781.70]KAF1815826.1 hypothetical protein P152DRAFT_430174 [Eremomyces bilateralis CBS 781.70]
MKLRTWITIVVLQFAVYTHSLPTCINAVQAAINTLAFIESQPLSDYDARCRGRLRLISFYASTTVYCEPDELKEGLEGVATECSAQNTTLVPISEFEANLTEDAISHLRIVERFELDGGDNLTVPVLLSEEFFNLAYKTIVTWEYEIALRREYAFTSYAFWGIIIVIGTLCNYLMKCWERRSYNGDTHVDADDQASMSSHLAMVFRRIYHITKMYFSLPAGWKTYHLRLYYGCTVPTRMETIIVIIFWAMSITLSVIKYPVFYGNVYWLLPDRQLARYFADRTGELSYAHLPVLWLFSGRNNVLQWATGWSFGTFNIYHRHVARVATLQAVAHSIAYHHLIMKNNGMALYREWIQMPWFYLGIFATILMSILPMLSSIYLRIYHYEFFLLVHITFSLIIILTLFVHTSIFHGVYDIYLWPVVVVWVIDRSLRLVRLVYCNIRISLKDPNHPILMTKSTVTYSSVSNVLRITVTPGVFSLRPKPGTHYYIYAASNWFGWDLWESHPFTLASLDYTGTSNSGASRPLRPRAMDEELYTQPCYNSIDSDTPMVSNEKESPALVFYIRPFDGFTKRLRDMCLRTPNRQATVRLLLEGPYGHSAPLENFETLVLIAGGTGIAGTLPYIREYVNHQWGRRRWRTENIHFIWTTQQAAFINEVASKELRPAFGRDDLHMLFYATSTATSRAPPGLSDTADYSDNLDTLLTSETPGELGIQYHRPDVPALIRAAVAKHRSSGKGSGRVGILVCGPAGMADSARATVVQILREGFERVEYFEEAYGW